MASQHYNASLSGEQKMVTDTRKRMGVEEEYLVLEALRSPEGLSPYFKNPRGGKMVQQLEEEFAKYLGVEYAVAVSNGTSALHTAYAAGKIKPGEKVAVPAHSFIATASMVLAVGGRPVFVDVDPNTYCMDVKHLEKVIDKYNVRVVVPVDLLGYPCDMEEIWELGMRKKLLIVEDACQALGSERRGKKVGSWFNSCAVWSGQWTKSWTMGEGGMITTNDAGLAERCRSLRSHGSQYLNAPYVTYNFRATEMQAAVGLAQLRRFPKILAAQKENAMAVMTRLPRQIQHPYTAGDVEPNWYIIGCKVDRGFDRDSFLKFCEEKKLSQGLPGRVISKGYTQTLYQKPLLKPYAPQGRVDRRCPVAESLCHRWLWFDNHRFRQAADVESDMKVINDGEKENWTAA